MIEVICAMCGNELTEPGALLISPLRIGTNLVVKRHLCTGCNGLIESVVDGRNVVASRPVPL